MRVVPLYSSVRLEADGREPVLLHGQPARIASELCEYAEPVPWDVVAREVWRDETDEVRLRQNWDRNLRLLRERLREARLRDDLVLPDGHGNVALNLLPGDEVAR
jgi:hypothetical protein